MYASWFRATVDLLGLMSSVITCVIAFKALHIRTVPDSLRGGLIVSAILASAFCILTAIRRWKGRGLPMALHHVSLPVKDLGKAVELYSRLLGHGLPQTPKGSHQPCSRDTRPEFPFDGVWYQLTSTQHLHLVEIGKVMNDPAISLAYKGALQRHFALRVPDIEEATRVVLEAGARAEGGEIRNCGVVQRYFSDYDDNVFELHQISGTNWLFR